MPCSPAPGWQCDVFVMNSTKVTVRLPFTASSRCSTHTLARSRSTASPFVRRLPPCQTIASIWTMTNSAARVGWPGRRLCTYSFRSRRRLSRHDIEEDRSLSSRPTRRKCPLSWPFPTPYAEMLSSAGATKLVEFPSLGPEPSRLSRSSSQVRGIARPSDHVSNDFGHNPDKSVTPP